MMFFCRKFAVRVGRRHAFLDTLSHGTASSGTTRHGSQLTPTPIATDTTCTSPQTIKLTFITPNPQGLESRQVLTAVIGSTVADVAQEHQLKIDDKQGEVLLTADHDGRQFILSESREAMQRPRAISGHRNPELAESNPGSALILQKMWESLKHMQDNLTELEAEKKKLRAEIDKLQASVSVKPREANLGSAADAGTTKDVSTQDKDEDGFQKLKEDLKRTRVGSVVADSERAVSFDDIIGLEMAKRALREAIVWPARASAAKSTLFKNILGGSTGLLLYGPPGCGKTMLARAAAAELRYSASFFHIRPGDVMDKFYGESQKRIQALEEVVHEASPAVVFFDEVDTLLGSRGDGFGAKHHQATTNALLEWMDGLRSATERVFFLGATNRPELIDEAALRRFGEFAEVGTPSKDARLQLIKHLIHKSALKSHRAACSDADLERVAACTEGFSLADVHRLVRRAYFEVLRQLDPGEVPYLFPESVPPLRMEHFDLALADSKGTSALHSMFKEWASTKR